MIVELNLIGLPHDKFIFLIENFSGFIQRIEETVSLYIELNSLDYEKIEEIFLVLHKKSSIDMEKAHQLLDKCSCSNKIKEQIKALNPSNQLDEKEWIVYYNHMDIGHRVKAENYTDALLLAYERYGSDGKITKVEKA